MVPFAPALSLASGGRFELIESPHYKRPVIPGRKGVFFYPACFRGCRKDCRDHCDHCGVDFFLSAHFSLAVLFGNHR
jgi:hypothetical protein